MMEKLDSKYYIPTALRKQRREHFAKVSKEKGLRYFQGGADTVPHIQGHDVREHMPATFKRECFGHLEDIPETVSKWDIAVAVFFATSVFTLFYVIIS